MQPRCGCSRVTAAEVRGLCAPVVEDRNPAPINIERAGICFPATLYRDGTPTRWFLAAGHGAESNAAETTAAIHHIELDPFPCPTANDLETVRARHAALGACRTKSGDFRATLLRGAYRRIRSSNEVTGLLNESRLGVCESASSPRPQNLSGLKVG